MSQLQVINTKNNEISNIDVNDVSSIKLERQVSNFFNIVELSNGEKYRFPNDAEQIEALISNNDSLIIVDRGSIVNRNQVEKFINEECSVLMKNGSKVNVAVIHASKF